MNTGTVIILGGGAFLLMAAKSEHAGLGRAVILLLGLAAVIVGLLRLFA